MGKKRKKRDAEGQMTFDLCGNLSAEGGEVKGRDTLGQGSQTPMKRKHEPVRREDLMGKIADLGSIPVYMGPEDYGKFLAGQDALYRETFSK
jgi:hypothetical protein